MCGSEVAQTATECPSCGEQFAPLEEDGGDEIPEYFEETISEESETLEDLSPEEELPEAEIEGEYVEETTLEAGEEELEVEGDLEEEVYEEEVLEELAVCKGCDAPLPEDATECPECGMAVELDEEEDKPLEQSEGCPICGSSLYSVESGDLVSCDDCGNVYIKKEYVGPPKQNWKLKFWVGLIFIIVGDLGVALGSYVHNVARWSPLGDMYLGYGWMDQMVGIIGIVLFIFGLILFSWSFKRDREVTCPSCKVVVTEKELLPVPEEEEEEAEPEPKAIETAMEEIGDAGECPSCGAQVSIFDEVCPNCETPLEFEESIEEYEEIMEEVPEEEMPMEEEPPLEPAPEAELPEVEPGEPEYVKGSELDETQMVLESLELIDEEEVEMSEIDEEGMKALQELEAEFEISSADESAGEQEEMSCPECGMLIEPGSKNCPICGVELPGGE